MENVPNDYKLWPTSAMTINYGLLIASTVKLNFSCFRNDVKL